MAINRFIIYFCVLFLFCRESEVKPKSINSNKDIFNIVDKKNITDQELLKKFNLCKDQYSKNGGDLDNFSPFFGPGYSFQFQSLVYTNDYNDLVYIHKSPPLMYCYISNDVLKSFGVFTEVSITGDISLHQLDGNNIMLVKESERLGSDQTKNMYVIYDLKGFKKVFDAPVDKGFNFAGFANYQNGELKFEGNYLTYKNNCNITIEDKPLFSQVTNLTFKYVKDFGQFINGYFTVGSDKIIINNKEWANANEVIGYSFYVDEIKSCRRIFKLYKKNSKNYISLSDFNILKGITNLVTFPELLKKKN